ncbi:hypothetical protein ACFO6V_17905 [Promicromonospora alba]|uniref:BetI-type transcriptional repressor C-terminal domain-containing protein n=1 Tax=Promicromonospora alba TaxID=1616110 RepID=A0ABV9HIP3_9MICO
MIAEAVEPDHPAHDWAQQRLDSLTEELKTELVKERDRGRLRDGLDIDSTAQQIAAMVRGLQLHWLYRRRLPTDRFLSDFIDLIRADG